MAVILYYNFDCMPLNENFVSWFKFPLVSSIRSSSAQTTVVSSGMTTLPGAPATTVVSSGGTTLPTAVNGNYHQISQNTDVGRCGFKFADVFGNWHASRRLCCVDACQNSEWLNNFNTHSRRNFMRFAGKMFFCLVNRCPESIWNNNLNPELMIIKSVKSTAMWSSLTSIAVWMRDPALR